MSIKTALYEAISIIMSYECDIRDCKNQFGVDLVKMGFCQGSIYKNALRIIKKKKKEKPEVTEEWVEEKANELLKWKDANALARLGACRNFICSLVEKIK